MNNEDLMIAADVMAQFIGTHNAKENTKDVLMIAYSFNEEKAVELAEAAWDEWLKVYS